MPYRKSSKKHKTRKEKIRHLYGEEFEKEFFSLINNIKKGEYKRAMKQLSDIDDISNIPYLLHAAVGSHNFAIIKHILERNVDVNTVNKDGFTPLHLAAQLAALPHDIIEDGTNDIKIVELLMKYGADPSIPYGTNKTTILHNAARRRATCLIDSLFRRGMDPNVKDGNEKYAIDVAFQEKNWPTLGIISTFGGRGDFSSIIDTLVVEPIETSEVFFKLLGKYALDKTVLRNASNIIYIASRIANLNGNSALIPQLVSYGFPFSMNNPIPIVRKMKFHSNSIKNKVIVELKAIVIKMKSLNIYSNEINFELLTNEHDEKMGKDCQKEIHEIKKTRFVKGGFTYYDVLSKNINELAVYLKEQNYDRRSHTLNQLLYKHKFPIYSPFIDRQLQIALKRQELLEKLNFFELIAPKISEVFIPVKCIQKICNYLSNLDLFILNSASLIIETNQSDDIGQYGILSKWISLDIFKETLESIFG